MTTTTSGLEHECLALAKHLADVSRFANIQWAKVERDTAEYLAMLDLAGTLEGLRLKLAATLCPDFQTLERIRELYCEDKTIWEIASETDLDEQLIELLLINDDKKGRWA